MNLKNLILLTSLLINMPITLCAEDQVTTDFDQILRAKMADAKYRAYLTYRNIPIYDVFASNHHIPQPTINLMQAIDNLNSTDAPEDDNASDLTAILIALMNGANPNVHRYVYGEGKCCHDQSEQTYYYSYESVLAMAIRKKQFKLAAVLIAAGADKHLTRVTDLVTISIQN